MKELRGLVVEVSRRKVEDGRAAVEDFVDCLTGVDERWVVAEGLHSWVNITVFELDPGIGEAVLCLKYGDVIGCASVSAVGVAENHDCIADGPSVDVISNLLDVCSAGSLIAIFRAVLQSVLVTLKMNSYEPCIGVEIVEVDIDAIVDDCPHEGEALRGKAIVS